jgi:hypothetical protein
MAEFNTLGGVGILGFVSPIHTNDTYAVIDPLYGTDGLRNVQTIQELNDITFERRRPGMIVGVNGGEIYFKLNNVENEEWAYDLTDWKEIDLNKVLYSDKEIPSGELNSLNTTFFLENEPIFNSEHVYLNGVLQDSGEENDYIIEGNQIEFLIPPRSGSKIRCSYRYR